MGWILELTWGTWRLVSHDLPDRWRNPSFNMSFLEEGGSADSRVPALGKRAVLFPRTGLCPWDQAPGLQVDNHSKPGRFPTGELEAVLGSLQS